MVLQIYGLKGCDVLLKLDYLVTFAPVLRVIEDVYLLISIRGNFDTFLDRQGLVMQVVVMLYGCVDQGVKDCFIVCHIQVGKLISLEGLGMALLIYATSLV